MTKKKDAPSLPAIFNAIDNNRFDFYSEMKGKTSPWVLMRWASLSKSNPLWHILMTNELVNKHFSVCNDHEKLQWYSIALVGDGTRNQYQWIPPYKKKKSGKKTKYVEHIAEIHPDWKEKEVQLFVNINTESDLKDYIEQHGRDIT